MSGITTGCLNCGGRAETGRANARCEKTEIYVHGRNGTFRDRDSHGGDSFPSKG